MLVCVKLDVMWWVDIIWWVGCEGYSIWLVQLGESFCHVCSRSFISLLLYLYSTFIHCQCQGLRHSISIISTYCISFSRHNYRRVVGVLSKNTQFWQHQDYSTILTMLICLLPLTVKNPLFVQLVSKRNAPPHHHTQTTFTTSGGGKSHSEASRPSKRATEPTEIGSDRVVWEEVIVLPVFPATNFLFVPSQQKRRGRVAITVRQWNSSPTFSWLLSAYSLPRYTGRNLPLCSRKTWGITYHRQCNQRRHRLYQDKQPCLCRVPSIDPNCPSPSWGLSRLSWKSLTKTRLEFGSVACWNWTIRYSMQWMKWAEFPLCSPTRQNAFCEGSARGLAALATTRNETKLVWRFSHLCQYQSYCLSNGSCRCNNECRHKGADTKVPTRKL